MSLDYQSKSGWYFNATSAGTTLLGLVHKLAGAALSRGPDVLGPRPPFSAPKRVCLANAARIAAVTDKQIAALLDDEEVNALHGGTRAEFVAWIRDWQAFLSNCGGYDTDPKWALAPGAAFLEWTWERGGKCGSCERFDPNLITELGSGHCALLTDKRVHEHQHCVLNPAQYAKRVVVEPAPLGEVKRTLPSDRTREEFFRLNLERLCALAYRAVTLHKLGPREFAVIAIDVDDPAWTEVAELLMPNQDWQQYRDRGESPVGRGSISWDTVKTLCEIVPGIKGSLAGEPPAGQVYALICAAGGCSVYSVPYIPARAAGGEG